MRKPASRRAAKRALWCVVIAFGIAVGCSGQSSGLQPQKGSAPQSNAALESEIKDLRSQMALMKSQMESQMAQMAAETSRLRAELDATREQAGLTRPAQMPAAPPAASDLASVAAKQVDPPAQLSQLSQTEQTGAPSSGESALHKVEKRLASVEEQQGLLQSEVKDQNQEKVESASKYRVQLSGIALFNAFTNRGQADNLDVPQIAEDPGPFTSNATFGATVRQSEIGLQVFGPDLAGARIHGEVQTDFFGGFPSAPNGSTSGIMRIRTATVHLDWQNTSVVAGQDSLFFAPVTPTSFASLAEPAFAYSGSLWAWVPQIRVEHRFHYSESSSVLVEGCLLDSLSGEPPYDSFYSIAQAGEQSGQPAYAGRLAWQRTSSGRETTLGLGGYYGSQNWGFGRNIPGWALSADWNAPLGRWFSLSGEIYRGHAVGGLGAGLGRSVLYNGPLTDPLTSVLGLNSVGGWGQLKFHPLERLEFNVAFGEDESFASDLRRFQSAQSYFDPALNRNQSGLFNVIFYPRSDLVLSLEYRRLRTSEISNTIYRAGQVNLGIGVLF
ncbi:MAG TPA: hypothetical protein VGX94_06730 [Terriglobia bacterium]|nr:hypothetical protein [Terriglobia bacterium]